MKKLLLLITSAILTGCGQYTKNIEVDCKDHLSAAEQVHAKKVVRIIEETIYTAFGTKYDSRERELAACHIVTCQSNAVSVIYDLTSYPAPEGGELLPIDSNKMNNKIRAVCVPQQSCASLELGSSQVTLPFSFDYSRLYTFFDAMSLPTTVYDLVEYNTQSCMSSEECGEGQVLNTSTESCVNINEPCLEEELPSGASSGVKVFNTETNSYSACLPTMCGPGFALSGEMCVPDIDPCMIAPGPGCPNYCLMFPMDPICGGGGPEECALGEVLNTNTDTCVEEELSCTEEELSGIGAATGYKQFNTMTNEYDLCQALTCIDGYTLGLGICNPDVPTPVYGCMDSRAVNYDPGADTDDMSCVCDVGQMPYNPITGCEEMGGP